MSKGLESVELGAKVLCKGYLKKTYNFITNDKDIQKDLCKLNNKPLTDSESGYLDGLGNEVDWEEQIKVKEFVEKEFVGFICGKKNLHTTIYPTVFYQDFTGTEYDVVCKDNYVLCYEVCVENKNKSWGKRYVPVDKVEVIA